ncbi:unnamed protein product, partial [Acanthoscelides obtectus]
GPNKVGILGLVQPFRDAINYLLKSKLFLYYQILIYIIFLLVSRLGVYTVILAGWASNSNYALLGSLRAVAQTISYEAIY